MTITEEQSTSFIIFEMLGIYVINFNICFKRKRSFNNKFENLIIDGCLLNLYFACAKKFIQNADCENAVYTLTR